MNGSQGAPRRYRAFLSYRHSDNLEEGRGWAAWLMKELEHFQVPQELIDLEKAKGRDLPQTLSPVFRDDDSMPANHDLGRWIKQGLERSEALIVLCSPRSAASTYVRDEIRMFKEMGKADKIQAIILDGEPNASAPERTAQGISAEEECFPHELRYGVAHPTQTNPEGHPIIDWAASAQPLAADVRPKGTRTQGFCEVGAYRKHLEDHTDLSSAQVDERVAAYEERLRRAVCKLIAGLLEVPLEDILDRDAEHRARLARKEAEQAKLRADLAVAEAEAQRAEVERAELRAAKQKAEMDEEKALVMALKNRVRLFRYVGLLVGAVLTISGWFWWHAHKNEIEKERMLVNSNFARAAAAISSGDWYETVRRMSFAAMGEQGDHDAAELLHNILAYEKKNRLDLPDVVFELPEGVEVLAFEPEKHCVLIKHPPLEKNGHQKLQLYDYIEKKSGPLLETRQEGGAFYWHSPWLAVGTYEMDAKQKEHVWVTTFFRLKSDDGLEFEASPGVPPGAETPLWGLYWWADRILLKEPGGKYRWWNLKEAQWSPEVLNVTPSAYILGWEESSRNLAWKDEDDIVRVLNVELGEEVFRANEALRPEEHFILSSAGDAALVITQGYLPPKYSSVVEKKFPIVPVVQTELGSPWIHTDRNMRYGLMAVAKKGVQLMNLQSPNELLLDTPPYGTPFGGSVYGWHLTLDGKELWLISGRNLCKYNLPCRFVARQKTFEKKPGGMPLLGESIYQFLPLVEPISKDEVHKPVRKEGMTDEEWMKKQAITALLLQGMGLSPSSRVRMRDKLRKELDDPKNFPDLSPEWKELLKWWTTKPSERGEYVPSWLR